MKIAFACITLNRLHELKERLDEMKPYVDELLVIDGGSTDDTIHYLRGRGDVVYRIVPWSDNFSAQRTKYIDLARERKIDWVFVGDTDEQYTIDLRLNLRMLAQLWEDRDLFGMAFRSEEKWYAGDKLITHKISSPEASFYKPLGLKVTPTLHYEGNPHEAVRFGTNELCPIVNCFPRFAYVHIKQMGVIAHRGARNFYIGQNDKVAKWYEFRRIVEAHHGNILWPDFDRLMLRGELAKPVEQWILDHRHDNERPGDSEVREVYLTYYRILHPEKDPSSSEHIAGQEASIL